MSKTEQHLEQEDLGPDAAAIAGKTARPTSETQQYLQQEDLGPDVAAILSRLGDSLEGKWTDEGLTPVDDAVLQQLSELKNYHEVFKQKRAGLVRFKANSPFRVTTPVYFVPLKTQSGSSSISTLPKSSKDPVLFAELKVGSFVYVPQTVRVALPLDVLLLRDTH